MEELNARINEVLVEEFILTLRNRFAGGKSWAEIEWEEDEREEEEERKKMEERKAMDAIRKKEWELKNYDAEEGEIFE